MINVKLNDVFDNKNLMDHIVSYDRKTHHRKVKSLFEADVTELEEGSPSSALSGCDYEPILSHISHGEYGNCMLVLYRRDEEFSSPTDHSAILYSYAYKGDVCNFWFLGRLKNELEFEMKLT